MLLCCDFFLLSVAIFPSLHFIQRYGTIYHEKICSFYNFLFIIYALFHGIIPIILPFSHRCCCLYQYFEILFFLRLRQRALIFFHFLTFLHIPYYILCTKLMSFCGILTLMFKFILLL